MAACATESLRASEKALDDVVAEARAFYGDDQRRVLDDSQTKWLAYRDSYCHLLEIDGGSATSLNAPSCKADLTRQRTLTVCTWLSPNAPLNALTADFPSCKKALKE